MDSPVAFICYNKDSFIRKCSSSGGLFFELARYAISDKNGIVYGATFSKGNSVEHIRVDKMVDLVPLMRSKYVQSKLSGVFKSVKDDLWTEKFVLFVGTPCQVEGLVSYLGTISDFPEKKKNLFTVDFICHGVPSPLVWTSYLKSLEDKYGSSADSIDFRNKRSGWHDYSLYVYFANGKSYFKSHKANDYTRFFLNDLSIRPSCYECCFRGVDRCSDLSIADAWAVETIQKKWLDDKGVSLTIVHTSTGKEVLDKIQRNFKIEHTGIEKWLSYCNAINNSPKIPVNREDFWKSWRKGGINSLRIDFSMSIKEAVKIGGEMILDKLKLAQFIRKHRH